MSLCDSCKEPGACCKALPLLRNDDHLAFYDDTAPQQIASFMQDRNLPFIPLEPYISWKDDSGRVYSAWRYSCPKLTASGRCSIYDDRPKLCRDFIPGQDKLCVMREGPAYAGSLERQDKDHDRPRSYALEAAS